MRCYDRRQLSFGRFNVGCLLGRAAGGRVELAIRSRIGFALLPVFKSAKYPGAGEGPTVGGRLRIDRTTIHASARADTTYQLAPARLPTSGCGGGRPHSGNFSKLYEKFMPFVACVMTKLPGKLLQTDSMWDAGTAIMAQAANKQELISKQTALAVQSAFHALDQAILIHNAWTLDDLVPLKGMVCEMIRPMLKAWLDDKLPAMVERLVRTEIERRRS